MDEQEPRRKRPLILAGLAGVVALVLGGLAVLNPASASDLANVRALEPAVRLQQPNEAVFKPVTSPVATNEGAKLETDATGMAEISFFDGSLTRLGPGTEYELSTLEDESGRAIVADLDIGRTYHRVTKATGSDDRFEVRTANAVAAVRGTRFVVICEVRDVCVIGVIDGIVEVTSRLTGERVVLRPGEEITVAGDGGLSPVRPLNLDDPWIRLNLELDGIDVDDLRRRLFGEDELPATDDDPEPAEVDGDGDGTPDAVSPARSGGPASGGSPGGTGSGGPGSNGGGPGGGPGEGDQVLGEVIERPQGGGDSAGPGRGDTTSTTARPGRPTTTTRPDGENTTTTRPRGTTTTRPRGNTTTTRPSRTTTTRPGGTTSTTQPTGTTSTTSPNCTTGYPPRPC